MQFPEIDLSWLWAGLTSAATGAATWLFARRKNNAEAALSEVEVADRLAKIWRENTEHLRAELERSRERFERRITDLEQEIHEERRKMGELQSRLHAIERENLELKAKIRALTQRNGSATTSRTEPSTDPRSQP